ncbi:RDD family protein [Clostridium sp. P21]|uniref:RDD family protein n=1 Tax=Clostridium muellerianum TaxID=2716538 RepID=A0A7Y0EMA0_9CLOT|nr:RDD family protein [Clostridium muellerianum]NMM66022.1 RDD family protein [Clostridium muellerianum]
MKKIKIITPENIEVEYTLADVASRTGAAVIDTAIQCIFYIILLIAAALIKYFSIEFWMEYHGWIIGILIIISMLISYGYFIYMELNMNGQTFGKKVLKLRTIRRNGQPLTLKHSLIRNLFRIFIDTFGVGIVLMFFSKDRRRLGDFAASTIVIADKNKDCPITLENLEKTNENFSYYISKEENELVREYLGRKNDMDDCSELREELKLHFTKKFDELGILDEWKEFINSL